MTIVSTQIRNKKKLETVVTFTCNICGTKENLVGIKNPTSSLLIDEQPLSLCEVHVCDHCLLVIGKFAELRASFLKHQNGKDTS